MRQQQRVETVVRGSRRGSVAQPAATAARFVATLAALLLPALAPCVAPVFAAVHEAHGAELQAALEARPDVARGATLYRTCAACHGADGGGVADGTIPAIAGQPSRVLVKQLADFRRNARLDVRMEHFADRRHLEGAQDIADVAAYAATLLPGSAAGRGDGAALAAGSRAWFDDCAQCHGATGQARPDEFVPRLAGQHAGYLERQLLDTVAGRRPNMTQTHRRMLQALSPAQLAGMADYLSRMK